MSSLARAAVFVVAGLAAADDTNVLLPPPSQTSDASVLLVWVPGGLVPNTYYTALMQEVQKKLSGSIDLWVSIASCPGSGSPGGLCIPSFATANITAALESGREVSGIRSPSQTWIGGHSLGGVATDYHVTHETGKDFLGGAIFMGDYVFEGPSRMLDYPVPLLSVIGEINYGSSRPMKMAPFFAAAEKEGPAAHRRAPIVVLKDIDHSDMCEGFQVDGDLPSALAADEAVDSLASAAATFMQAQVLDDVVAHTEMDKYIDFTREYMQPLNAALALDLRSADWCAQLQSWLVPEFADKISVSGLYNGFRNGTGEMAPPSAESMDDGSVAITVTSVNVYETANAYNWPPQDPWPFFSAESLHSDVKASIVDRDTPSTQGCRLVSPTKIAALLGRDAVVPRNFCERANRAAWRWALEHALPRSVYRYYSPEPCNGCSLGASVVFKADTVADDYATFANSSLGYQLGAESLVLQSASFVSEDEYACQLFSPSKALDFLIMDAFTASTYGSGVRVVV